jgi:hypothetical protein
MYFSDRNKKLASSIKRLIELEIKCSELTANYKEILRAIEEKEIQLNEKEIQLKNEITRQESLLVDKEKALKKIFMEKSQGFPWLSEAIAEYYKFIDFEVAEYLENKSHPAYKRAEAVRAIGMNNSLLRKQLKVAQNFVNYYETLFPWITEYVGENLDELLKSFTKESEEEDKELDPVLKFVPRAEYEILSEEIRNQKALDRYLSSRGHPWQIGRDYERYIGYLYEIKGYKVDYEGIEKGLEDLGRDLVCTNSSEIEIVQCKCWASYKTIHEKHINQLYGTAVKYYIDHTQIIENKKTLTLFPDLISSGEIKATFITSTKLSVTAKKFADALGIKVEQEKPLQKYPVIKCNIASDGTKIYHLPFDQQYDTTLIKNPGEFYASTVKEAMSKGFRRAYRWRGIDIAPS